MLLYIPWTSDIVWLCPLSPRTPRDVFIWDAKGLKDARDMIGIMRWAHVLMQLISRSPPHIPYDAPMPHARK